MMTPVEQYIQLVKLLLKTPNLVRTPLRVKVELYIPSIFYLKANPHLATTMQMAMEAQFIPIKSLKM